MQSRKSPSFVSFRRLGLLLTSCFSLWSIMGMLITGSRWHEVHAAEILASPLAIIAVDATNQECTEKFRANIGTLRETTTLVPCLPGTIISTKVVPLAQALIQHKAYVLLPSTYASHPLDKQTQLQIKQIMRSTSHILLQQSTVNRVYPSTNCGSNGSASVYHWHAQNYTTDFTSTEQFYVLPSPNCSQVSLDTASMQVYTDTGPYFWSYDLYAGGQFNVPGSPNLIAGHTYSHSVNQVWPKGYYYETWAWDPNYGNGSYCNIPIN